MRQRKKEMDKIVDMLSAEAESVDDLASDIWKLVDDLRRGHELWVVGVNYVGVGQFLFGPYESKAMAQKDLEGRGNISKVGVSGSARIFQLTSPSNVIEPLHKQGELDWR